MFDLAIYPRWVSVVKSNSFMKYEIWKYIFSCFIKKIDFAIYI